MTPTRQYQSPCRPACRQRLSWLLLALLLIGSISGAQALTLGNDTVLSALGDPVEVEIDVLDWDDVELGRVEVALAGRAEYESFKLTWLPVLEQLDFNLIGPNPRGEVKLLVSTREPVVEPYVELLLVLRWPGGSLLREYVLLFDLPAVPAAAGVQPAPLAPEPAASEPPASAPQVPESEVPEPAVAAAREQGAIVVDSAAPPPVPAPSGRRVYQVREGDGLWDIARQFQPAGADDDLYRMLLSLHDLNRAAFINGNISLLRVGASLQIPDADDIAALAEGTAREEFEQRWADGTQQPAAVARGDTVPVLVSGAAASGSGSAGGSDSAPGSEPERDGESVPDDETVPAAAAAPRVAGEERGPEAVPADGLLLPATAPVLLSTDQPAPDARDREPDETGLAATTAPLPSPGPDLVDGTARDLQQLLQDRQSQVARLEQQLVEMQQRMREAQEVTARLNQTLEQALARQNAAQTTQGAITLLGVLSAILVVALLSAMAMLLKLTLQLRKRRGAAVAARRVDPPLALDVEDIVADSAVPPPDAASPDADSTVHGIVVEEETLPVPAPETTKSGS